MRQISSRKTSLSYQCLYATAFSQNHISAHEEAGLTVQYVWKKRALHIKNELGIKNRVDWANALSLTPSLLLQAVHEAEMAEKRLLAMGLRLSLKLVKKQYSKLCHRDFYDYIQDGLLTFFDAVESFDPSKGIRLSTYAYSRIKFYFADLSRMYEQKIPFSEQENFNEFDNAYRINEIDSETSVVDIRKALRTLPDRQRLILEKRFGIQRKAQPISDIAKDFGVSYETIRKDQNAAISALSDNCSLKTLVS